MRGWVGHQIVDEDEQLNEGVSTRSFDCAINSCCEVVIKGTSDETTTHDWFTNWSDFTQTLEVSASDPL